MTLNSSLRSNWKVLIVFSGTLWGVLALSICFCDVIIVFDVISMISMESSVCKFVSFDWWRFHWVRICRNLFFLIGMKTQLRKVMYWFVLSDCWRDPIYQKLTLILDMMKGLMKLYYSQMGPEIYYATKLGRDNIHQIFFSYWTWWRVQWNYIIHIWDQKYNMSWSYY